MTLRQRFAAWLCAPLGKRIAELERVSDEHGLQFQEFMEENIKLRRFCEQLSSDMAKQAELRSVLETVEQPRVRVVNGSTFVGAAQIASQRKART